MGIGVFGGFIANIILQMWLEKRQSVRVLKLLKRELEVNLDIIRDNIRKNLEKMKITYAPLELGIWKAVSNKIDLITNDKSLQAIAKAYYQFDTLEKAMDTLEDHEALFLATDQNATERSTELKKRVLHDIEVILEHVREPKNEEDKTVISYTKQAIFEIQEEINRRDC